MLPSNHDRMNGLDFFFSPSATVAASTGICGEDDDWGEFVDSSDAIDSPSSNRNGFFTDRNGSDLAPNRIESEDNKSHTQWVTSRGPVPLSVFGEEEEDESGAMVSPFNLSFDSFSSKQNNGTGSLNRIVNSNPSEGISGLIANLYRENGQKELKNVLNSPEKNDRESLSGRKTEISAASFEKLNWNPLNLDTERSERTSNVVNSGTIGGTLDPNPSDLRFADNNGDDDVDGWEFKTADSIFRTVDEGYKEEQENAKSGSVVIQNTTNLSSSVWNLHTNGIARNFDTGKTDAVESVFDRENGDDGLWDNGGWEFKAAEAGEPKNDVTNKESNDWGFGFGFEPISRTTSLQPNIEKEPQKREHDSNFFQSNANVNSGGTWAFEQPCLESGKEKEEKEVQKDNPKGILPLSFFEDEKSGTSDILVHEDNLVSACNFPVREKTKAPSQTVSINDLISSLYSQVEEKKAVNLSEKSDEYGFVSIKAATDSNLVNGEDDSWELQGPKKTITDSSIVEGADEFQGPSLALKNSVVTEGIDEFDDDSWEFKGPTLPVKDSTSGKGDNGSWEYKHSSMENEFGNQSSVPNGFGESHENPVIRIEPNDYQVFFHKLKTELYYIALKHLETLKDARDLATDFDEPIDDQNWDGEIEDLQNLLNNYVLRSEVNLESLQPKSSCITEIYKALQEPKFQALDAEDLLSERLLLVKFCRAFLAEKDWKSTIELLKHVTLTLKILNLGSPEQQLKYASTWFVVASACAQELRHASSIWKQVMENDVQEEILSKPQGKIYALSVGEIYRVAKILRASTRLYKPWISLAPTSSNVLANLDECVKLWLSSGLEEALMNHFNRDDSADQLLESIKCIDEVDAFALHTYNTSATSPTCYISGLNTETVPGIKTVEWNGEHYLLPLANLWANLISRDPPSFNGHCFPTVS